MGMVVMEMFGLPYTLATFTPLAEVNNEPELSSPSGDIILPFTRLLFLYTHLQAIQLSPRRRTSSSVASQFSTTLSPSPIPSPSQTDTVEHSTRVVCCACSIHQIHSAFSELLNSIYAYVLS